MNGWFGREAINEFIAQHINEHRGFFLKGGFSASDEDFVAARDLGSLPVAAEAAPALCGKGAVVAFGSWGLLGPGGARGLEIW